MQAALNDNSKINADFIIGAIVETTGLPISAIGKIELYRDRSIVEMEAAHANLVLKKMNGYRIKQRTIHITVLKGKKSNSFPEASGKVHAFGSRRHINGKKRYNNGSAYKHYNNRSE